MNARRPSPSFPVLASPAASWPIALSEVEWVLCEAAGRGLALTGATRVAGAWTPTAAEDVLPRLLAGRSTAWLVQRPGCAGIRTSLRFVEEGTTWGAWLADVGPGAHEPPRWRTLLLEALVRSWHATGRPTALRAGPRDP